MKHILILLSVATIALTGACGPKTELVATRSRRVEGKGNIDAVIIESAYKTKGLHGQQMLYEVGLLDARRQPIRSDMRSYRNREGQVAAGKTVMAEEVTGTANIVSVKIPVSYMGLTESDLPVYARVKLTTVGGETSVEDVVQLPLSPVDVVGASAYAQRTPDIDETSRDRDRDADAPSDRESDGERYAAVSPNDDRGDERSWDGSSRREEIEERDRRDRERRDAERRESEKQRRATRSSETKPRADRTAKSESSDDLTYWGPDGQPVREGRVNDRATRRTEDSSKRDKPRRAESEVERRDVAPRDRHAEEIAALESQVRSNPNDVREQMKLRLKYLAVDREADALAPIAGTSTENQELIDEYMAAILPAVRSGQAKPENMGMGDLDALLTASRQQRGLQIPVAKFCRSIDGFGEYSALEPATFSSRNFPRLLVYLEVENYTSTRARTGVYRTLLSVQQKLLDADGVEQWSTLDQEIPDVSNERRRQFYLAIGPIDFQKTLPEGGYTLVVTLRDVLGGTTKESRLEFRVR